MYKKLLWPVLLLAVGLLAVVAAPPPIDHGADPRAVASEIVRLTNAERQKVGAPPLQADAKMTLVAEGYAAFLAKQGDPGHDLDGKDAGRRLSDAGDAWRSWGENVAFNYPDAESVVQAWMLDEAHRRALLDPGFTEIGVGVAYDAMGQPYYDQVLAQPAE